MKPKFALDLSHEGINLLHRRKGGWSLVGTVDLDDPEMGAHLADLRRRAAALESGGLTCKIIIPNSQVLYTTLEAPGPDDIAREVQIRSGLDGLTPYPVGELVFDWRAAGERARVAVLARETMDEAETFAVEHRFNPVSFVARPPAGEFSGEPFFGKTRAATKILGPSERVEPDASPVPRKPSAMDPYTPPPAAASVPGRMHDPVTEADFAPHSPGELAWHPAAEPEPTSHSTPARAPVAQAAPDPEPVAPPPRPDPADDPFAELDAIQAELSGDFDAAPTFRSRTARPQGRPARPAAGADQRLAPPLAPFPPTSDEADALPAPPHGTGGRTQTVRSRPPTAPAPGMAPAPESAPLRKDAPGQDEARRPASPTGPAASTRPTRQTSPEDDMPAQPGVAFSTRRNGDQVTTTATPTTQRTSPESRADEPSQAPARPAATPPVQPGGRTARKDVSAADRRRANMADALSKPLPGQPAGGGTPKEPEKAGGRGSFSGAMRGAADGLRALGQRRAAHRDGAGDAAPKPTDSSMTALMRGAGSRDARISPDRSMDEPDLLAPEVAGKEVARSDAPAKTPAAAPPQARDLPEPPAPSAPAKPAGPPSGAAAETAKAPASPPAEPGSETAAPAPVRPPASPPAAVPATPEQAPRRPRILDRAPTAQPEKPKAPANEAEALTVFGARRTETRSGGRKYLGLLLTLLLLLAMAIIGLWSSFFVDDPDPALFNPDADVSTPAVPDATEAPQTDDTTLDTAPAETGTAPAVTTPDETAAVETPPVETDTAPTPQVLTPDEADALYAESQVWQRAPETLGEPFTPGLDLGPVDGPDTARDAPAAPTAEAAPAAPALPGGAVDRAAPLPPPPADTVFDLGENGLVAPSPEGTVSPTGIIVYQGAPEVVPPDRPQPPALPEDATLDDAALEQAVEQAVEAAAALTTEVPAAEVPDEAPAPDAAAPETAPADEGAQLDTAPTGTDAGSVADAALETAAADPASIEAAVDAVATNFVNATTLAVATSVKPTQRPDDIDQIVNAAMARAAAAPPEPAVATAPATTTPAIPTSASVASQATTPNAINLKEINLLGISGPTNARRALVRMENGRYVTVKVGDRLDGGRVTSITSDGLTYQKGARNYTLQLLPLG
ncbi:MAG: hypothetical protein R3D80_17765 [Paracoccaceae bacterium]